MRPSMLAATFNITQGRPLLMRCKKPSVQSFRFLAHYPHIDLYARTSQILYPSPGDLWIGILHGGHHARDSGIDEKAGARWACVP